MSLERPSVPNNLYLYDMSFARWLLWDIKVFQFQFDLSCIMFLIPKHWSWQVTVFKQTAAQLAALNKRLYGIRVGDFRCASSH